MIYFDNLAKFYVSRCNIKSSDGTIDQELSARKQKATDAFNQLNNIWNLVVNLGPISSCGL